MRNATGTVTLAPSGVRTMFAAAAEAACAHPDGYRREVPVVPLGAANGDDPTAVMMCDRCALCVGFVA